VISSVPSVGVDIGGTATRVAVGDGDQNVLRVGKFPTREWLDPDSLVSECRRVAADLVRTAGFTPGDVGGLGVVVPGSIDAAEGRVRVAANLGWKDVPLATLFGVAFGAEARIENDANAAALGEWHAAGEPEDGLFLYITVGTGVGSGMIFDGEIWRGHDGLAGEMGHVVIDRHGPVCRCGARGCLEAVASGHAMERMAQEAARENLLPDDARTPSEISAAADAGNEEAQRIMAETLDALVVALRNAIHLLNPSRVCLGGGVIRGTDLFAAIEERLEYAPLLVPEPPTLMKASLEDDAGLVGALRLGATANA
jgi:glucokinase